MDAALTLAAMLEAGPVLLSGAVGTELQRRGVPTPLPLWSTAPLLEAPDAVRALHAEYIAAGAQIVTANTFRTDRVTLGRLGLADRASELTALAVRLAREAVAQAKPEHAVLVAGSIAPLEDCYRPDLVPTDAVLRREHKAKAADLVAAGSDLALIETMNTAREARAALEACQAAGLPALVSFVCGAGARLLSGEGVVEALAAMTPLAPRAVLVNCCAPEMATEALVALRAATDLPLGVYANGEGGPDDEQGWTFEGGTHSRWYVQHARAWLAAGASLVGGCCGTGPRDIHALAAALRKN